MIHVKLHGQLAESVSLLATDRQHGPHLSAGDLFGKGLDPLQAGCHISADAGRCHGMGWGLLLRTLRLLPRRSCACSALKMSRPLLGCMHML